MNIKQLNEEIGKLLLHELSPETKQWAADTRKARYLAAKATTDREKAKLDKTLKMQKALEPKTTEDIEDSLLSIAHNFCYTEYGLHESPKQDGNDFFIIITNADIKDGKLEKSAEAQLEKLLKEMSKKYGCKYYYVIEGTNVRVICEKPKLVEEDDIFAYMTLYGNDDNGQGYDVPDEYTNTIIRKISDDLPDNLYTDDEYDFIYFRLSDGFIQICGQSITSLADELLYDTQCWQDCENDISKIDFERADLDISKEIQEKIKNRKELTIEEAREVIDAYEQTDYSCYVVSVEPYNK